MDRAFSGKALAGTAMLALVVVALYLVGSVTRTISDTQDNKDTLIRNTNGHYWEPTEANLQTAINELVGDGGTVWVGSSLTVSNPIELKDKVTVDFLNNHVTLNQDVNFVLVQDCYHGTVRNVEVFPTATQTASIIRLYTRPGAPYSESVWHNTFENIIIRNTGVRIPASQSPTPCWYYRDQFFAGIHMEVHGATMALNKFRDILIDGPKTAIWLEKGADGGTAWSNGNLFESIYVDQYERGIWFDVPHGSNGFNQNLFSNIKAQSGFHTMYGSLNVSRNGNHFDHILWWDWDNQCCPNVVKEWNIRDDAWSTFVEAHHIIDMDDQGSETLIVCPSYP